MERASLKQFQSGNIILHHKRISVLLCKSIITFGNLLLPMRTAECLHLVMYGVPYFSIEYHNHKQNIIILIANIQLIFWNEAWLNLFVIPYINRKILAVHIIQKDLLYPTLVCMVCIMVRYCFFIFSSRRWRVQGICSPSAAVQMWRGNSSCLRLSGVITLSFSSIQPAPQVRIRG